MPVPLKQAKCGEEQSEHDSYRVGCQARKSGPYRCCIRPHESLGTMTSVEVSTLRTFVMMREVIENEVYMMVIVSIGRRNACMIRTGLKGS